MTDASTQAWHDSNQAYLAAALEYMRAVLETHVAAGSHGAGSAGPPTLEAPLAIAATMSGPPGLEC